MEIGFLVDRLASDRGGAERYLSRILRIVQKRGHGVTVVTRRPAGTSPDGVRVLTPVPRGWTRPGRLRHFAVDGEALAREAGVDVVIGCGLPGGSGDLYWPHGGCHEAMLRDRLDRFSALARPLQHALRRLRPTDRALLAIERENLKQAVRVVALSQRVARAFEERGVEPDRLRVIPNGVDGDAFQPPSGPERKTARKKLQLPDEGRILLFVAHHPPLKGISSLIAAVGRRPASEAWTLLAVGRRTKRYEGAARRAGVRYRALGEVEDVRPAYRAADLLCHPTHYDPCSLVCLEAMAMGLPVVTTRRNGVAELMEAGDSDGVLATHCLLDRSGEEKVLARKLGALVEPDLRDRIGRRCREIATGRPLEQAVDELLALGAEVAM